MATFAARRLGAMNDNTRSILAIEYLAAAQGVGLLAPLATSVPLQAAVQALRSQVPPLGDDRMLAPDIEAATTLLRDGSLVRSVAPLRLPGVVPA